MKYLLASLLLCVQTFSVGATTSTAKARLNAALVPIYHQLTAPEAAAELIGQPLQLRLRLRHASEHYLLFNDTQVVVDDVTRYYLIQWRFEPTTIADLIGKSDLECSVSGQIVDVVKGATTPGMPYLVAELLAAAC